MKNYLQLSHYELQDCSKSELKKVGDYLFSYLHGLYIKSEGKSNMIIENVKRKLNIVKSLYK